jgi:hypothetical protein
MDMRTVTTIALVLTVMGGSGRAAGPQPLADGTLVKAALAPAGQEENRLQASRWGAFQKGFRREGAAFVCDNGPEAGAERGVTQGVVLNQTRPEPIVAVAWSKAEGVTGASDAGYSIYLDLEYDDGTPLWGQTANFTIGTHDWERRRVLILPERPVRRLSFHLLFRGHEGKAFFRDAQLHVIRTPEGTAVFDGVPVARRAPAQEGFQVRDVPSGSGFVALGKQCLGLRLEDARSEKSGVTFHDATLSDTTGKDRAVTLVYAVPFGGPGVRWLSDPRRSMEVKPHAEAANTTQFRAGVNGRLSKYPLGAVVQAGRGLALGIDMARPAFYRIGYNAATGELFLAYDIGLTPEKPTARVRFCTFGFDPGWGFRAALARYYQALPEQFVARVVRHGLWMPFAKISAVKGWEDFGFQFKEGDNETLWDAQHGIDTFRYTEPMTWWMKMPPGMPRTMEAAWAEARRLAEIKKLPEARALMTSGYHDAAGQTPARLLDTPWCNGAVWSMNSMPGVRGDVTHFRLQWNEKLCVRLYGPDRKGRLAGEYIDSSEGYVTDELDFRRDHFAAAGTPLCFAPETWRPAIFRGLIAFEYARGIADDVHRAGRMMMANGAPTRLCWLVPLLEVAGTETNWNRHGRWVPMPDAELLYRRALCKGKPYCFLMNTEFEAFSYELVEKYMKRSLAYGMFPGFFSQNASEGHYFTRPELYDRDRPLFKKYVPLCKRLSEAGWEPVTLARSNDEHVYLERFGRQCLTVFNDSPERRTATITLDGYPGSTPGRRAGRELLSGRPISWQDRQTTLTLAGEDVAVLEWE